VNALSAKVREGLLSAFRQASDNPAAKAIILICRGKTFIAGADIGEEFTPAPLSKRLVAEGKGFKRSSDTRRAPRATNDV
jgi:enoyl-CoA hydratase/carnithine racemase